MRRKSTLRSAVPASCRQDSTKTSQPQASKRASKRPFYPAKKAAPLILQGKLPPHAIVKGCLSFGDGRNPVFPIGVTIKGNLRLLACGDKTRLAPNMTITGIADFSLTPLTALPSGFWAKVSLDVSGTRIRTFPRDMKDPVVLIQLDDSAPAAMKRRAAAVLFRIPAAKASKDR